MLCYTAVNSLQHDFMHVFFNNIFKLFKCGIEDRVRLVILLSFIFSIVTLDEGFFFNLLQCLHEMVGGNATRN